MSKKVRSDEEQLDELLVALQKKFLSGDAQSAPDRKKTKEELDDEKFQAQLAAMLGSLSASSQKIKKTKKKASPPPVEEIPPKEPPTAVEEVPISEEAPIPDERPIEAPTPAPTPEKKPRKKSARSKKVSVEKPVIEDPTVEEPIVEEPILEEPIVEEPIVEEPINSVPIVIKPRVRVIESEPSKPAVNAIRITSPTTPKSDEPIRIVPKQRAEERTQPLRHTDAIVIRPKGYPTPPSEPIVIKPRAVEKARPIPQKQSTAYSAQPIKIGKEKSNDPNA